MSLIPHSPLSALIFPKTYIWIDVTLIHETPKAILIAFDSRHIWLPKAWILRIRRCRHTHAISIKISEYHWAKKV